MRKSKSVPFLLMTPPEEILVAYEIIQKLFSTNGIKLKNELIIKLDFSLPSNVSGLYFYEHDKFSIYVDPQNCTTDERFSANQNDYSYFGYTCDLTMVGVTIHECCHFLAHQVYKGIFDDYRAAFPTKRLYLNEYSCTDAEEELTEIMRLYIENPKLLTMIDKEVYLFVKRIFKSPMPNSDKHFYGFYKDYPEEIRDNLRDKWGIVYNIQSKKFERM
jgi:hypothetical protein